MSEDRPLGRRQFFRRGFLRAARSATDALAEVGREMSRLGTRFMDAPGKTGPFEARPPGAVEVSRFRKLCTQCNDCTKACPAWAIRFGTGGYPVIEPNRAACALCEDPLPCIASCETGALVATPRRSVRMGLAWTLPGACCVPRGEPCDLCLVYCPLGEEAIRMSPTGPLVLESGCTGCGLCAVLCPEKALEIGPPVR